MRVKEACAGEPVLLLVMDKPGTRCPIPWMARLGIAAFCFFLLKGLLWLTVPAIMAYFATR